MAKIIDCYGRNIWTGYCRDVHAHAAGGSSYACAVCGTWHAGCRQHDMITFLFMHDLKRYAMMIKFGNHSLTIRRKAVRWHPAADRRQSPHLLIVESADSALLGSAFQS